MKRITKLLVLAFAVCALVAPASSWAAYDTQYANGTDNIFQGNLWTGFEEMDVDGAQSAYHAWYEDDGKRADYYMVYYDAYTTEWCTYSTPTGNESWVYIAAYDGSYEAANEYFDYTTGYSLDYSMYNDGTVYSMEYEFESDLYDYSVDLYSNAGTGAYENEYDYESEDLVWSYEISYDPGTLDFSEYKYMWDPANGKEYEYEYWKNNGTGAYRLSEWTYEGTATKTGSSWSWDYTSYTETYESFSPDYSEVYSSFIKETYSDEGDTQYEEWSTEYTDTGYYDKGWSWEDETNDEYEYYSEELDWDWYGDYHEVQYDKYTKYSHYEEYLWELADGSYLLTEKYYRYDDGKYYYYEDHYKENNYDNGHAYTWDKTESRYYEGEPNHYYGSGTMEQTWYEFDPTNQEESYSYDKEIYAKGYNNRRTYDYRYSESSLKDSIQHMINWDLYTYYADTGSTQTYETYDYSLNSDLNEERWTYRKSDYTGPHNTSYYERHEKNLSTGAYSEMQSYEVSGVSYVSSWKGQDPGWYWEGSYSADYVNSYFTRTEYTESLSSGFSVWTNETRDSPAHTWTATKITTQATGVGQGYMAAWDGTNYDITYYGDYPDSYFVVEDFAYLPGTITDDDWYWQP